MERHIQADNAFLEWMEAMSKNVVHIADAWYAAVKWADSHPQWIPVEERLPEEGQVVFIYTKHGSVSSVTYKDGAFNLNEVLEAINVTHWMPIVPPRKEANNETE